MNKGTIREGLQRFLAKIENGVEAVQFLLSAAAVFLVVSNEFVSHSWRVPGLELSWPQLQVMVRVATWSVFLAVFAVYALASGRLVQYTRKHLLELIVCVTWVPSYYSGSLVEHLTSLLSLEMLTVIGSIAHAWRVARWSAQRFAQHPMIVITATAAVLVGSASALLTQVEPQTFPSMFDAVWFCIVTIFTVGYGDLTPKTHAGRVITSVLIIGGVALAGVFIAYISKLVSQKLLNHDMEETTNKLSRQVEENNRLLKEAAEHLKDANDLNRALMEELKRRPPAPSEKPDEGKEETA